MEIVIRGEIKLTLELALGGSLDDSLDLLVGGSLLDAASKVDNGDVGGGHTHGHTGELAVKLGDNLADSLGGTGGGGDDVLGRSTATTPVLRGRSVNGLLGGGVGVDGGHETLNNSELIVDDLGEGSKAVGGARGVGENVDVLGVRLVVDTHNEHGGIGGRSGDDDLLGTTLQVSTSLLLGGEDTGGLNNVIGTGLAPGDGRGVTLSEEGNLLAVDKETVAFNLDVTLELAVGGVVLQHVGLLKEISISLTSM